MPDRHAGRMSAAYVAIITLALTFLAGAAPAAAGGDHAPPAQSQSALSQSAQTHPAHSQSRITQPVSAAYGPGVQISAAAKAMRSSAPRITGTPKVTRVLRAAPGTWTKAVSFRYQWYAGGKSISGATKASYTVKQSQLGKRITVKVTARKAGFRTTARTSAQTAAVTYPASTSRIAAYKCPSWAPVKGNHSSSGELIYHVRSGAFYTRTNPEQCFRTEAAARNAGYRRSLR